MGPLGLHWLLDNPGLRTLSLPYSIDRYLVAASPGRESLRTNVNFPYDFAQRAVYRGY